MPKTTSQKTTSTAAQKLIADAAQEMATVEKAAKPKAKTKAKKPSPKKESKTTAPRKARKNTKQSHMIAMLRRPEGATISEMMTAFGWQAHTCRGAISLTAKKLGVTATRNTDGTYHLPAAS